jgi:hypothetical protein
MGKRVITIILKMMSKIRSNQLRHSRRPMPPLSITCGTIERVGLSKDETSLGRYYRFRDNLRRSGTLVTEDDYHQP